MPRKPNQSTLEAYNLIGTIREDGKKHTCYSAAEKVNANKNALYKYVKAHPVAAMATPTDSEDN